MKTSIELPSGVKISISARFKGFDTPGWEKGNYAHPHHRVTVCTDRTAIHPLIKKERHTFDFWDSRKAAMDDKEELTEYDLIESVCSLMSDACAWDANRDFVEFCAAFGYEKMSEYEYARAAFVGCAKAYRTVSRLFGRNFGEDHSQLEDYATDVYNRKEE